MPSARMRSVAAVCAGLALAIGCAGAAPALAQSDDQSGAPGALDPCQVVTSDEASALAGATFGQGVETADPGGSQTCVYGGQTSNVFMVTVAQAADAPTAQADWAQEQADAQAMLQKGVPQGVNVNLDVVDVPDLAGADRAATGSGSGSVFGRTINGSALYVLKGATFVAFSDLVLDQAAPTSDALESEGQTVLGRLP